jgi:dihydrofolate reductase
MISLIAAVGRNMEIGWKGRLPWYLPNDLKNFKETTINKTVIMGRATYNSMLNVTLADRVSFVVSREPARYPLAYAATSVVDAINKARNSLSSVLTQEIVMIGGVGVYREALPYIDRAYITLVEGDFKGDRHFPVGLEFFYDWTMKYSETFFPTQQNQHQHTMFIFDRPRRLDY